MSSSCAARLRTPVGAAVLDALLILVFAALGRRAHDEGGTLTGILSTAWPFLVGAAIGWVVVRLGRKGWPVSTGPGITVWFGALLIGMVLRRVTGGGTATPFVIVAAITLGLFMVGRRALQGWLGRRSSAGGSPPWLETGPDSTEG